MMNRLRQIFLLTPFNKGRGFRFGFFNFLKVIFLWCPIVSAMFLFGFGGLDQPWLSFSISMIIAVTVSSTCFLGALLVNVSINRYRRNVGLKDMPDGVFYGILTSYPFLIPGLYVGFRIAGIYCTWLGHVWTPPAFKDYSSGVVFGVMVSGLFSFFQVVRERKEEQRAAESRFQILENEKLKAQVSALSAQLNPHLLFNALNTVASTIATNPKAAEDMVVQLSELYRGILRSAKEDMHTLGQELDLCRAYLEIEKMRFGSRIEYSIHIDTALNPNKMRIPVLLLQPLVENAVKHGLSPKKEGGRITVEISTADLQIFMSVTDNGVGIARDNKMSDRPGTGTGILNCESRVKLKYGEDSKFSFFINNKNETTARIQIPMKAVFCD